ncbi:MAG: outer membrane beta-barrel protein, partial [Flavobacteriales bacterium]|nr:outer membrane beta-barrel protein [Flavobacteriales bacterium]
MAIEGVSQAIESDDCVLILKDAERLYEQGKLEVVPIILAECIENGFSREEKIQAYRLLTLTYLFDDKTELAEQSIENMLKIDPEHEINTAIDPAEFIYLYNEYRTNPIATFGISAGVNISMARLLETYSLDNSTEDATYYSQAGFHAGIHGSYMLMNNLHINIEGLYKTGQVFTGYTYKLNNFDGATDTLSNFGSISFVEKHTWVRIPANFTYDIKITPKISTYLRVGGSVGVLLSSKSTFTRAYHSSSSLAPATGPEENVKENRNLWNYWITGGLGFKYKITRGNVFIDVRYNYGLRNMTNETKRYNNPTLIYKYYYLDDNFSMDDIAFSIGYSRFLYKPKKKKKEKSEKDLRGYKRNL